MNLRDLHHSQSVTQYVRGDGQNDVPGHRQPVPTPHLRTAHRTPSAPWAQVGFAHRYGIGEDPYEVALMLWERDQWLEKSFWDDDDKGVTFTESQVDGRWQEGESFR